MWFTTLWKVITPYGVKGDRSVKTVKSYSKWSENLLKMEWYLLKVTQGYSISSKILLFLQSDPLFYSIFFTVYREK